MRALFAGTDVMSAASGTSAEESDCAQRKSECLVRFWENPPVSASPGIPQA